MNSPYCIWWLTHSFFLWIHAWPQDAAGTVNMIVLQLGRGTGAQLGAVMNATSFAASPGVGVGGSEAIWVIICNLSMISL